jgi:hypothetical protein
MQPPVSLKVSIAQNANVVVSENNIAAKNAGEEDQRVLKDRLARILDIAADLDVWVEFIKEQIQSAA